ncbi:MAG: deaminase [Candidatus Komeilibacteria bacterium]|nr:deaminase [Candidatus Komeilibacteria bacterium]
MDSKIITLNKATKILSPNVVTIISGSFEPFNEYYLKLLKWSAKKNQPLVVIVQKNDMVTKRRAFTKLSTTHNERAEIIAKLPFVDYVIIANATAHDKKTIQTIKPKVIILQHYNLQYKKEIKQEIHKHSPQVKILYSPNYKKNISSDNPLKVNYLKHQNKTIRLLLKLSAKSPNASSKISAILKDEKNNIIVETSNSQTGDHAEILLLKQARQKNINLSKCSMYILIPPCIMCAKALSKYNFKKLYYIFNYGSGDGLAYLKNKGIIIKKYNESNK